MAQLPLRLVHATSFTRENFVISDANREAFSWVEQWPHWPAHCLIVYGEQGCGKTHLAHIWRQKAGAKWIDGTSPRLRGEAGGGCVNNSGSTPTQPSPASGGGLEGLAVTDKGCYALENIESITDEEGLLHLFNRVKEQGGYLLLTANTAPAKLPFTLPDLTSRLQAVPSAAVHAPDENLLKTILIKFFSDNQLKVTNEVIDYMLPRMERSFPAVQELVKKLDERAMEEQRNITVPLVRQVMEQLSLRGA